MNLSLNKTDLDDIDEVHEDDGNIRNEKIIEENKEEINRIENMNHDDNREINEDNDSNDDNHENIDKLPVRRSERIKKRIKDISPEDIGENDNAKDKDYKG